MLDRRVGIERKRQIEVNVGDHKVQTSTEVK